MQEDFINGLDLSKWDLPNGVFQHYKKRGILQIFPWQLECLSLGKVLEGENLVYSAPTSAGKTLVAEILVSQTVFYKQKKALIILPFVSVVREKMFYFQEMFSSSGVRVEGFMGGHTPSASFNQVKIAVCTIEKANALVNRMMEEKTLDNLGIVVVDELHLLGDPYRGYLLELLLTKLKYMSSQKGGSSLQIVGMSATLPNLNTLAKWLNARLYFTDFRPIPLSERLKCGHTIFDAKLTKVTELNISSSEVGDDSENVGHLCIETIGSGHSVLIFCPTKVWCENLAVKLAGFFRKLGCCSTALNEGTLGWILRKQLDVQKVNQVMEHLRLSSVGLDNELCRTIPYGVAFHHAGLTLDERDIIEGSFRNGSIRVLCATSTLSSGVNLPARRVIIRSPMSFGGVMDVLTYRQMIGRAGRMGVDSEGESILICKPSEKQVCQQLMSTNLKPIESCLGSGKLSASLKRAILEVIASGVACTPDQINVYAGSTFLAASSRNSMQDPLVSCLEFLEDNELIRLIDGAKYIPTPLGQACLASSLPPDEGLALFKELERARRCFVLDSDLHIIYQVTPYSVSEQWSKIDWLHVLNILEELPPSMKRVADLVGVEDAFLIKIVKGTAKTSDVGERIKLSIHRRFYTALALQELINEVSLPKVAVKYDCNKGMLQSLQQSAATYAGMVSEFCRRLRWETMELIVSQFQERLQFGVQRELCELMKLPSLNGVRARTLFNAGFTTLSSIANAEYSSVEQALLSACPFQSKAQIAGEADYEHQQRTRAQAVWITGRAGLTSKDAAEILVQEARNLLELELGVGVKWDEKNSLLSQQSESVTLGQLDTNGSLNDIKSTNAKNEQTDVSDYLKLTTSCHASDGLVSPKEVSLPSSESSESKSVRLAVACGAAITDILTTEEKINKKDGCNKPYASSNGCENKNLVKSNLLHNEDCKIDIHAEKNALGTNCPVSPICDFINASLKLKNSINEREEKSDQHLMLKEYEKKLPYVEENYKTEVSRVSEAKEDVAEATCLGEIFGNTLRAELLKTYLEQSMEQKCFTSEQTGKKRKRRSSVSLGGSLNNSMGGNDILVRSFEAMKSYLESLNDSHPKLKKSRFSTDLFEASPKPFSTPTSGRATPLSLNSPDLFSQSLTFDTQLQMVCDSDDVLPNDDSAPTSPPRSDDLGFFSESSLAFVEESNLIPPIPCAMESVGESFFTKTIEHPKRCTSPDTIAGSDESVCDGLSRRSFFRRRLQKTKSQKRNIMVVTLDASDEDEEIASTPTQQKLPLSKLLRSPTIKRSRVQIKKELAAKKGIHEKTMDSALSLSDCDIVDDHKFEPLDKWASLNIIDVCGNLDIFKCFREELLEQRFISMALGCRKKALKSVPSIGAQIFNKPLDVTNEKSIDTFEFENLILGGIAFYWSGHNVFYLNMENCDVPKDDRLQLLRDLSHKKRFIVLYDTREQLRTLTFCTGISLHASFEDPKVAAWLVSEINGEPSLLSMLNEFLPAADCLTKLLGNIPGEGGAGLLISSPLPPKNRASYECLLIAHLICNLKVKLNEKNMFKIFQNVEMPLLTILARMEVAGFQFNKDKLASKKEDLERQLLMLEENAHKLAGRKFAVSSYAAIKKVLYTELRLGKNVAGQKNKQTSTSKDALEVLHYQTGHPLPLVILKWRKVKSTIVKVLFPLLQLLPTTRVHGSCQTFTVTGRISMREPNLQNVPRDFNLNPNPKDGLLSKEKSENVCLRDIFVAKDNYVLLSADYCQVELRILAHLSQDTALINAIKGNADVFVNIAASIYNVPIHQISDEQRQRAKQTCYGIIYGVGVRTLSVQLGTDEASAQNLMDDFMRKYSGVKAFLSKTVDDCRTNAFVQTLAGRRRYLSAISNSTSSIRNEAERQAINTAVQGSAADLVKTAMVRFDQLSKNYDVVLVLHLHDELIYEVEKSVVDQVANLLKKVMETAWQLSLPLPVKIRSGPSWGELWPHSSLR